MSCEWMSKCKCTYDVKQSNTEVNLRNKDASPETKVY